MKKKLIRTGVYETNSSSSHSLSIANETKEFVLDTIYPDQDGIVLLTGGFFGWDWFKHNDALTKANYAAQSFCDNETRFNILKDVIKEMTGADDVIYKDEGGYIDHQSNGKCPLDKDKLKSFIFNKNSWLFGGNDNVSSDPTFYHVPEYKSGRVINPKYEYLLTIDGFDKSTKFQKKPNKKALRSAFESILSGVKLIDRGAGVFFDNDKDSFYRITNWDRDYFEYDSMGMSENNIDEKTNEVLFSRNIWNAAEEICRSNEKDNEDVVWEFDKVIKTINRLIIENPEPYIRRVKYNLTKINNEKKA